jgi:hypothetical protein
MTTAPTVKMKLANRMVGLRPNDNVIRLFGFFVADAPGN